MKWNIITNSGLEEVKINCWSTFKRVALPDIGATVVWWGSVVWLLILLYKA